MTQPREFWWIAQTLRDGSEGAPEVAEIHEMSASYKVAYITGLEVEIDLSDVRLIERVLPPGRATAATLHSALVASGWHDTGYVGALQGCKETCEDGEPTGEANTLIDGYFDLAKAAEILAAGGDAA